MMDIDQYSHCIYQVHPTTIEQVIKNESNFGHWPLTSTPFPIKSHRALPSLRRNRKHSNWPTITYRSGHSVDLGLMQINSKNLAPFGVSIADMFTPCKNIHVGSSILFQAISAPSKSIQNQALRCKSPCLTTTPAVRIEDLEMGMSKST
ncbi:lytic transglycosylase domain-containing protein [Vibrio parahaemolyticus]|nr:lytic transglycosylase domain-containing protein [Vibrio parahaemolyticus]